MLAVGTPAPVFVARTTRGDSISLRELHGRIVVLYFFRRAFTPNCTVETKGFRDNYEDLVQLGSEVVGVSCDDYATQCRFASTHDVRFPMIADEDRSISRAYDVFFPILPLAHRVTYVIDRDGVIAGVFNHEFQVIKHLDEVVRFTRDLAMRSKLPPAR
ncbi:peroxiredoxin [Sandaracinus amylolyticus]|uniref:thioredoxin-dependent peroxiredoxin n=1 Tax=Sandaracinus amylolyticus TaxID=927083 RepID=A0A0F6W8K1_9BACT|nr:peroxiredoxin [Sandaracinus amylolyticus]AKF10065.1 Alkyl hydroperoxide reductase subunit C-like protein [Sandaracinus amylolyticus]